MLCSILFIMALAGLSQHESARKGNWFGITGMALAILFTFMVDDFDNNFALFFPAFLIGGGIGLYLAIKVEMISMPQLVALLHSFVGMAATLVGYSKYIYEVGMDEMGTEHKIETYVGVFIGAITFTGSVVACGKLEGKIRAAPLMMCGAGRHVINAFIIIASFIMMVAFVKQDGTAAVTFLVIMTVLAFFLGWHLVMAIGGADMPVVVSMLNSYSGWTTSASGFLLENDLLIITGALVGSSGAILSYIMCKAMNRAFINVIAGGFGQGTSTAAPAGPAPTGTQTETNTETLVTELLSARSVVIVPGYGMAVAKAQHQAGQLAQQLRKMGKRVTFCIHPVAGRLPGHMNVLLAEAQVPYDIVLEMDEINKDFPKTDLVMIIGANDIVNPDAQDNPNSPIAGMPVCEVWKAERVVIFKRGGGTGYAGVENPLFLKENSRMYFGSADKSLTEILNELGARGGSEIKPVAAVPQEEQVVAEEEINLEEAGAALLTIGIPRELMAGERRVAMTPKLVKKFRKLRFDILVESGAGLAAGYRDSDYERQGAQIVSQTDIYSKSNIVMKIRKIDTYDLVNEFDQLGNVSMVISYFQPAQNLEFLQQLSEKYPNLTYWAMDCVPRITRAQKLDSLSSMGNIAGYRCVMEAFAQFQRCPKAMVTAAGKVPPAKVFIIGCGVAGLSAIGYAKGLGCIVKAFDTRPAAREQAESMGAEFLEIQADEDGTGIGGYAKTMSASYQQAQAELTAKVCAESDIVITTALIPGKPAPKLIEEHVVKGMQPGSVIVDMAAEMGGNCSLCRPNEAYLYEESGVYIVGYTDLVSRMAPQSSELYTNNLWHLLDEFGGAENISEIDLDDEIVQNMVVSHKGVVTWVPLDQRPPPSNQPQVAAPRLNKSTASDSPLVTGAVENAEEVPQSCGERYSWIFQLCGMFLLFLLIGASTGKQFLVNFLVFVLAICIGYMVIWNVTAALHTPLMAVTNAISGIIVIGAMLELNAVDGAFDASTFFGMVAVFLASINVVGGFVVTHRMLAMFRRS